ncbi:hypothetical protein EMPS_05007 [Entomortierella parvispora]|uniref:Myb-like domain-containing protein n=1 Tax=Entomortierella parvispora TaxID=205924 RepID=A0A9P3H9N4_9FUNG|nr:hypothetical protein EMPS_05007 [Entomortierella parvispora]
MSTITNRVSRGILSHCRLIRLTPSAAPFLENTRWTPRFVSGIFKPFSTTTIGTSTDHPKDNIATTNDSRTHKESPIPWLKSDIAILESKVREGLTSRDVHMEFPLRSVNAIEQQMHMLRKAIEAKDRQAGVDSKYLRKWMRVQPWTKDEDDMLIQLVQQQQNQQSSPSESQGRKPDDIIDWSKVSATWVNGKRLGRTSTACQRRWDTVNPMATPGRGHWNAKEDNLLMKALRLQVPDLKYVKADGNGKGRWKEAWATIDIESLDLKSVDWQEVSHVVGTRSATGCRGHVYTTLMASKKDSESSKRRAP